MHQYIKTNSFSLPTSFVLTSQSTASLPTKELLYECKPRRWSLTMPLSRKSVTSWAYSSSSQIKSISSSLSVRWKEKWRSYGMHGNLFFQYSQLQLSWRGGEGGAGLSIHYGPLRTSLTVNALRTNSNLWRPLAFISYENSGLRVFSCFVRFLMQNNGINSEKCNEYGRRQCKISKDAWLSWIVYTL